MNLIEATELMKKYAECPDCGNKYVGNGQGGMQIEGETFRRWCKCGWSVGTNTSGEETEV